MDWAVLTVFAIVLKVSVVHYNTMSRLIPNKNYSCQAATTDQDKNPQTINQAVTDEQDTYLPVVFLLPGVLWCLYPMHHLCIFNLSYGVWESMQQTQLVTCWDDDIQDFA